VSEEYHRTLHSELGCTPMQRYLAGPNVGRDCPGSDDLRAAFRIEVKRLQRRSDGNVSLDGQRFEIPSRYRHPRAGASALCPLGLEPRRSDRAAQRPDPMSGAASG